MNYTPRDKRSQELICEGKPWLKKSLEASDSKRLHIYGCVSIKAERDKYYKQGLHKEKRYSARFEPNVWQHQYDLELYIFFNYKELKRKELSRLNYKLRAAEGDDQMFCLDKENLIKKIKDRIKLVKEKGPTGTPRSEHLLNAAEIRWPTEVINGGLTGGLVRDPLTVERAEAASDYRYNYIVNMAGGGIGKTHFWLAFGLMIFEYWIFTLRGAKCNFSTVSEDKIKSVAWPTLVKLHTATKKGISLYAGQSIISGSYTIRRPDTKDTASTFRGILAGKNVKSAAVVDKLTGVHGMRSYFYVVDEAQSSSDAPIEASANYRSTGSPTWVAITGNYDVDSDTLGQASAPDNGWENVDKNTGRWETTLDKAGGAKALVIHTNNERLPTVLDKNLAKLYPHLPNAKKRDLIYPNIAQRTDSNKAYRRFWIGFRSTDLDEDSVLTMPMIETCGAEKELDLSSDYPIHNFLSFDGAQGQGDRNPYGHFQDGRDVHSEEWVWGLNGTMKTLKPVDDIRDYFTDTAIELEEICAMLDVKSGSLVLDWSNMNGHVSAMRELGMECYPIQYQKSIPDGISVKNHQGAVEPEIIVNPETNPPMKAHMVCKLRMSLGAWALQQYVLRGRVRGLNPAMMEGIVSRSFDDEMLKRRFETVVEVKNGELLKLDSKEKFIKAYGFSTDLFDCWIQAAYYMLVCRGMPVWDSILESNHSERRSRQMAKLVEKEAGQSDLDDYNEIYGQDTEFLDEEEYHTDYGDEAGIEEFEYN